MSSGPVGGARQTSVPGEIPIDMEVVRKAWFFASRNDTYMAGDKFISMGFKNMELWLGEVGKGIKLSESSIRLTEAWKRAIKQIPKYMESLGFVPYRIVKTKEEEASRQLKYPAILDPLVGNFSMALDEYGQKRLIWVRRINGNTTVSDAQTHVFLNGDYAPDMEGGLTSPVVSILPYADSMYTYLDAEQTANHRATEETMITQIRSTVASGMQKKDDERTDASMMAEGRLFDGSETAGLRDAEEEERKAKLDLELQETARKKRRLFHPNRHTDPMTGKEIEEEPLPPFAGTRLDLPSGIEVGHINYRAPVGNLKEKLEMLEAKVASVRGIPLSLIRAETKYATDQKIYMTLIQFAIWHIQDQVVDCVRHMWSQAYGFDDRANIKNLKKKIQEVRTKTKAEKVLEQAKWRFEQTVKREKIRDDGQEHEIEESREIVKAAEHEVKLERGNEDLELTEDVRLKEQHRENDLRELENQVMQLEQYSSLINIEFQDLVTVTLEDIEKLVTLGLITQDQARDMAAEVIHRDPSKMTVTDPPDMCMQKEEMDIKREDLKIKEKQAMKPVAPVAKK